MSSRLGSKVNITDNGSASKNLLTNEITVKTRVSKNLLDKQEVEVDHSADPILAKLKMTTRKRTLLENQVVMNWLRNLARKPEKD